MLGPVFFREATVVPRRSATYLARSLYLLVLFVLLCTGYLVLDGSRTLVATSDLAKFGRWMFTLLAPLQLVILAALAAVAAASGVAQEKDRRTLILLLMTRLSGLEVVAGKAAATLLVPLSLLVVSVPFFLMLPLLGGVSPGQVFAVTAVTASMILVSASVGTVVALWREKTFQTLALTVLVLIGGIAAAEAVHRAAPGPATAMLQPFRALATAADDGFSPAVIGFVIVGVIAAAATIGLGIARVRIWNPSREVRLRAPEPETTTELKESGAEVTPQSWKVRPPRPVWDNPVLWREVRTWAYGKKVVLIRVLFVLAFVVVAGVVWSQTQSGTAYRPAGRIGQTLPAVTMPVAGLGVLAMVLINALAVTSITGERDGLALDLLLVTDLTPTEFILGKLMGVMYAAKEMIALPIVLVIAMGIAGILTTENTVYTVIGIITLSVFSVVLGLHAGMNHVAGRTATLASLGTVFFLCVGIAICMTIMVSFRGAFQVQLVPFLVMILGGGAALFATLGWRNPSPAIFATSFTLPVLTFYAITQFLLQTDHLYVVFAVMVGYGFTIAAMLVPALSEFDVALESDRDRTAGTG